MYYWKVPYGYYAAMQGRCATFQGATTCFGGSIKYLDTVELRDTFSLIGLITIPITIEVPIQIPKYYVGWHEMNAFPSALDSLFEQRFGYFDTTTLILPDDYFVNH